MDHISIYTDHSAFSNLTSTIKSRLFRWCLIKYDYGPTFLAHFLSQKSAASMRMPIEFAIHR
jgi:hypothetical protein